MRFLNTKSGLKWTYISFIVMLFVVVNPGLSQERKPARSFSELLELAVKFAGGSHGPVYRIVRFETPCPNFQPIKGLDSPQAVPYLINVLDNGPPWTEEKLLKDGGIYPHIARCYAALCLGVIRDERAYEPLVRMLRHGTYLEDKFEITYSRKEKYHISDYAALALGYFGDPNAVDPLIDALQKDGRAWAVYGLTRLHDFRAIRPIIEYAFRHNQSDFGHSIHRCLEIFTGARFRINYSSESRKSTVPDFPELGELETDKVFGVLWKHWLKEGDRLARRRIEEYSTYRRLLMEKKLDAANKFHHNGSPKSKVFSCGIAALPYIIDAIEKGDVSLVPIVPELTRGHKAKALHLNPELSINAKRAEVLEWWKKNKQKWTIFRPKASEK